MNIEHTIPQQPSAGTGKVTDEKQKAKLQRAMQDFEALFVNYLLKTMRKSVQKDEDGEDGGFGGEMMQEMFDHELARHISRRSSLGIAEKMYRQMTGESLPGASPDGVVPAPERAVLPKQIVKADASATAGIAQQLPSKRVEAMTRPMVPSGSLTAAVGRYEDIINDAAQRHGVDSTLIKAVIAAESAGNPKAVSSANAKGLMQLIDSTASMVGVRNVWDPKQNINGGAKYLRKLLDQFDGDVTLALAGYNAGPARVEKHNGVPPIPETRNYVRKVKQYMDHFASGKE